MNILLVFSYNGSKFNGYQIQPNKRSVQGEIESILSKLYNKEIKIYASGRTDAKVHAVNQYANFKIDEKDNRYDLNLLKYKLNKMLPSDIFIKDIKTVNEEFNARFAAISKIYEYKFTESFNHDVFKIGLITEINESINEDKINEAKNLFIGTKCFKNFTSKPEDKDNFIRTIFDIKFLKHEDNTYSLIFEGSGFMMYEVRMIAANIILYSAGKIDKNEIITKLNQEERCITSYCFPPEGLYLNDVKY